MNKRFDYKVIIVEPGSMRHRHLSSSSATAIQELTPIVGRDNAEATLTRVRGMKWGDEFKTIGLMNRTIIVQKTA